MHVRLIDLDLSQANTAEENPVVNNDTEENCSPVNKIKVTNNC